MDEAHIRAHFKSVRRIAELRMEVDRVTDDVVANVKDYAQRAEPDRSAQPPDEIV
jgi:hypothetical protein